MRCPDTLAAMRGMKARGRLGRRLHRVLLVSTRAPTIIPIRSRRFGMTGTWRILRRWPTPCMRMARSPASSSGTAAVMSRTWPAASRASACARCHRAPIRSSHSAWTGATSASCGTGTAQAALRAAARRLRHRLCLSVARLPGVRVPVTHLQRAQRRVRRLAREPVAPVPRVARGDAGGSGGSLRGRYPLRGQRPWRCASERGRGARCRRRPWISCPISGTS